MEQVLDWLWNSTDGYGFDIVVVVLCVLICGLVYSWYQSHLKHLLLDSPAAVCLIDARNGELLKANRQAMQLLGIRKVGSAFRYPKNTVSDSILAFLDRQPKPSFSNKNYVWELSTFDVLRLSLTGRKVFFHGRRTWLLYASAAQVTDNDHNAEMKVLGVAKTALDSLSELIYVKDNEGQLIATNRAFKKFWQDRHDEGLVDITGSLMKGRVSQRSWTTDHEGRSCLLETYQNVLLSEQGENLGLLSISHDVTDWHDMQQQLRNEMERRKDTEVALAQRDTILQNILEASPDSIGIFNENMVYQACNKPFVSALGIGDVNDLIGKRLQDVVPDEMYARLSDTDSQVLHQNKSLRYLDKTVSSDGSLTWYDVVKSPFRDPASGTNGVLIMARDVSERYLAEQKLEEANLELERLSFMDSLTQVSNRRRFDEQLSILWHHHVRETLPITVMLCDIDFFKGYNDFYGHQRGDEALVQVSQAFLKVLNRSSDCVARYGGEEFAFLLPNTTGTGAELVAKRIHQEIADLKLEHEKSTVSEFVTVSLGIISYTPSPGDSMDSAVALADSALYQAKANGRNQTCLHPSSLI
ncbi:diguanylate cyclase [Vibrio sp. T187]|uniref:sensor domain-containing diguanylate cyclase n=1 Tax=Vibrio TaxID=662 RepID=UPI0010C9EEBF|nr:MULTISPECIES: GGDEF domain-containing protein [Vibrio]MBW3697105.1 diguanylate cyclase [Vibrio sp. T187]